MSIFQPFLTSSERNELKNVRQFSVLFDELGLIFDKHRSVIAIFATELHVGLVEGMTRILKIFALVLFVWVSFMSFSHGQDTCSFVLRGKVLDKHNSEPLVLANIYISELSTGTVTDSLGLYEIKGLCRGKYTIKISHLGCEPVTESVNFTKTSVKNFYLEHHALLLREMSVSTFKNRENATKNLTKLSGKELLKVSGKPLAEQLSGETGVAAIKTGNSISKPMIRGLYGNRVLILNNSVRLEGQQWGQEHGPEVDPFQATSITIIKGASGIRYGHDAMGGVVLMEPGELPLVKSFGGRVLLTGESNNRAMGLSSLLEGKVGNKIPLSWRLTATGKKAGNTKTPRYYLKNTGFEEMDYSGSLGYQSEKLKITGAFTSFQTRLGVFSATHFGNLTDLKNAMNAKVPLETEGFSYEIRRPYQHVLHQTAQVKSVWRRNALGEFIFNYAWQRNKREEYDKEHRTSGISTLPEQRFEIFTNTGELIWVNNAIKNTTLNLGLFTMLQDNNIGGRFFIPAYIHRSGGVFLIQKWEQGKWVVEGGIRYDNKYFRYRLWDQKLRQNTFLNKHFSDLAWNGGLKYNLTKEFNIYLNHGRAWRPPSANEFFSAGIHHGAASIELGDTDLSKEIVYFESLGINTELGNWKINTEVYFSSFYGFIYLYPTGTYLLTIKGAFPVFEFRQTRANTYGWEGKVSKKIIAGLMASTKFSLVRGLNVHHQSYLINLPGDRVDLALKYDLTDFLTLKTLSVEGSVLYQFKQSRVEEGVDFAPPPDGFFVYNLNLMAEIPVANHTWQLSFSVENLLNKAYRNYLNRFRYFADETGRNFLLRLAIPFGNTKK